MGNVPGIRGNTYDLSVSITKDFYVKVGDQIITNNSYETHLFLMAYKMGRDHKKNEIRSALGV